MPELQREDASALRKDGGDDAEGLRTQLRHRRWVPQAQHSTQGLHTLSHVMTQ